MPPRRSNPSPASRMGRAGPWGAAVLGLLFLVLLASPAAAQPAFPPLAGRVVDAANVLPAADEAALGDLLQAHEAKTSDQIVVATVLTLGGTSVEDYANRLFRTWRLGQARTNNGVLVLVAPGERRARIEVGYGLEGTLTDALTGVIIRTAMAPRFQAGDVPGGIRAGVEAVIAVLTGDAEEWQQRARLRPDERHATDPMAVLLIAVVLSMFVLILLGGGGGGPGRPHRRRDGRWVVLPTPIPMGGGWGGGWSGGGGSSGGGFSGGGGSSGGGGASGSW